MDCNAPIKYLDEGGRRITTICGEKVYVDTKRVEL
jgi:hypothetical protein